MRIKRLCFALLFSFISMASSKACVDVTANELGWVFPLNDGNVQLFGYRLSDVTGQCVLISVKTKANGDTISINKIDNLPLTFSYSDFMDVDASGNYVIGGIIDSTNAQYFRVITLSAPSRISTVKTFEMPMDSFANVNNYDWRNVHGIGYLFFGLNKRFTYSTALLTYTGMKVYIPNPANHVKYQHVGDATLWQNDILQTGDYVQGNVSGTFLRLIDANGNVVKEKLLPDKTAIITNATQATVNGNICYISGYYTDSVRLHDIYCLKLNKNLDTVWTKVFYEEWFDSSNLRTSMTLMGTAPMQQSGIGILLKSIRGKIENMDLIAKIDSSGSLNWHYDLNQYNSWIYNFIETPAKLVIMAASTIFIQNSDLHPIVLDSTTLGVEPSPVRPLAFQIYPNPARGNIHIQAKANLNIKAYLTITDMQGKQVYNAAFNPEQDINIGHFNSGVYFIVIVGNDGSFFGQKVILE